MSGRPPALPLMKGSGPRSGNGSQLGIRRPSDAGKERRPLQCEKGCPMSHMKKSKFRRLGTPSNRRKTAEPDESKMEREKELSAGPKKESAATSGTAFEERPAPTNNSPSPGDNHRRWVRKMDDKENASQALFEGFTDVTKTLFSPENAKKVAALWIDNSEKAVDQALK